MENHLVENGGWEVYKLYTLALADTEACGVVRAKRRDGGGIVGSVVLSRSGSRLGRWFPALLDGNNGGEKGKEGVGGVLGPVVKKGEDEGVLVGLLLLGVRQNKANRAGSTFLDLVSRARYFFFSWIMCFECC